MTLPIRSKMPMRKASGHSTTGGARCPAGRAIERARAQQSRLAPPASSTAFEAHHALNDRFALLGDLGLLARSVRAVLAHFFRFARDLHAHELVDLIFTLFAKGHVEEQIIRIAPP